MIITILKKPWALLAGIFAGFLIAFFAKGLVPYLMPVSTLYLSLLKMCVIPIVSSAVAVNIRKLVRQKANGLVKRWLFVVAVALVCAAALGVGLSFAGKGFWMPDGDTRKQLSQMQSEGGEDIIFQEISYYDDEVLSKTEGDTFSVTNFLVNAIPSNIFESLSQNSILQIVFFFVVTGLLLGVVQNEKTDMVTICLEGVYDIFCKLVSTILIFLPVGMCAMLAVQFQNSGVQGLAGALGKFIAMQYLVLLAMILLSFAVIQKRVGCSVKEHINAVKRTFFVAAGTSSCIASVSVAMDDCTDKFHMEPEITRAILPIGITTFQYGVIASATIAAVYGTAIYPVDINVQTILVIIIGAIIFSFSIIGAPGVVAVSMLSIMLTPLGIPSEAIILIYLATIPFFDPVAVFASVYSNIAVTSLVAPIVKEQAA